MKLIKCARCHWQRPVGVFVTRCPECRALTEFSYNRAGARLRDSDSPLERYFDLLPLTAKGNLRWLRDGNTPTVNAKALAKALGMQSVWLKVEGANPTHSTKDRATSLVLSYFAECGIREFAISSTGNSSTACARGVQQLGDEFHAHIFVGRQFLDRVNAPDSDNVSIYAVDGGFDDAGPTAMQYCEQRGILWEGGFFNPARRAGHKLAYLEALDAMNAMNREPAWVVQAVSSGMGLLGAREGFLDYLALGRLQRMPRIIAAQQSRCAPMVEAWNEGALTIRSHHIVKRPAGLAKSLLRGNPTAAYPLFRHMVESTNGTFCSATDPEIVEARWLALTCEGVEICNTAAVGLACMIKLKRSGVIKPDQPVLVNLTGRDRDKTVVPTHYQVLSAINEKAPERPALRLEANP